MDNKNVAELTPAQLKELSKLMETNPAPATVWKRLGEMGDSYAAAAHEVITNPNSMGWAVVRGIWKESGANFDNFDKVADSHMKNYVTLIEKNHGKLPLTNQIETSYVKALENNGEQAKTAIDVCIEKLKKNGNTVIPHWYSTPGVMDLNPARFQKSDEETLKKVSPQDAQDMWLKSGVTAYHIKLDTIHARSGIEAKKFYVDFNRMPPKELEESKHIKENIDKSPFGFVITKVDAANQAKLDAMKYADDKKPQYHPSTGITTYHNPDSREWFFHDKNKNGVAHLDNKDIVINKDNFSFDQGKIHIKTGNKPIIENSSTKESPQDKNFTKIDDITKHTKEGSALTLEDKISSKISKNDISKLHLSSKEIEIIKDDLTKFANKNKANDLDYVHISRNAKSNEITVNAQVNEFTDYKKSMAQIMSNTEQQIGKTNGDIHRAENPQQVHKPVVR